MDVELYIFEIKNDSVLLRYECYLESQLGGIAAPSWSSLSRNFNIQIWGG